MKTFALVQHKLIPTALIAVNIAVVHLIFLLAKADYGYVLWATACCTLALGIGIVRASKYLLIAGIAAYLAMLIVLLL
ncbi:hypothetical protein [Pedobacter africanus]|uniref:Uncharacterized protein n=1 Tax=Pedobacter africanus TaxID=151894 RepID=A0A1W2EEP2_9SPHI|nr:hypothetical protein [Pedobacter africanus]SMD08240.1 hypothetical protein SAMN04488524_4737 [Pedobacter africanus]